MSDSTVAEGKVVSIHYTLTLDDGQTVDSSSGREPMDYLHGAGNIIPGLEKQIDGRKAGDKFDVHLEAGDAYGEIDPEAVHKVSRSEFPEDAELGPGMQITAQDQAGNIQPLWIVNIDDSDVLLTANHPLAGKALNFNVEVVDIRDASAEETEHGHPHPPGGHCE